MGRDKNGDVGERTHVHSKKTKKVLESPFKNKEPLIPDFLAVDEESPSPSSAPMTKIENLPEPQQDYVKNYARFLYEVKGMNAPNISKNLAETNLIVSQDCVSTWRKEDKWLTKGEAKSDMQSWTRQKFIEAAVNRGYDLETMMEKHIEGITEPEIVTYNEIGLPIETKPDYKTRHMYLRDFWAMTGLMGGPGKGASIEVNAGEGGIANIQIIHPGKE